jgi:BirA family biotin operon repressor/biotin-[acetyl-CoA-carboxylase] ligase
LYKIPATTLFLGKNLIFMPECHSTNDMGLQLCQKPFTPEGTLVITDHQTAGRGQRGASWEAEPGKNLTFTFILKPGFLAVQEQFFLNIVTSLAIRDHVVDAAPVPVKIKWPNDVLADGKKICGILIENQLQGNQFSNSIVGIGLNINQVNFGVATATSLSKITGRIHTLQDELDQLLQKLETRYLQLKQGHHAKLLEEYLEVLHWRNEKHTFQRQEKSFEGMIVGIDEVGRLRVLSEGGERVFGVKEIAYVS